MTSGSGRKFLISGVCCATEETLLRKTLDDSIGEGAYSFNPTTGTLTVGSSADAFVLCKAVTKAGFKARSVSLPSEGESFWGRHADGLMNGAAALLALIGGALEYYDMPLATVRLLQAGALLSGGWKIVLKAIGAIRVRSLDMNVLMTAAVVGAVALGEWAEATAVVVLYGLSLALESYSVRRSRNAISGLMDAAPDRATVVRNGREESILSRDIRPGEMILIRPGERIPLDGVVAEGHSAVVEAAITGESTPVLKEPGSVVYAGSMNQRGGLRVQASRAYEDTMLVQIIHMVEEAQQKRAAIQTFTERFARVYTPAVFALAAMVAVIPPLILEGQFAEWFYRALVLLVIACPCALVISTPVTIVSAITAGARCGILIKGGSALERISRVRAIAFDKTGTLTHGSAVVTDIILMNSIDENEALRLAAAIEMRSEHTVADAILTAAENRGIDYSDVEIDWFESHPGRGVQARIKGVMYFLGNHRFALEQGYATSGVRSILRSLEDDGKSGVVFGRAQEPVAVLAITDRSRQDNSRIIERLRREGIVEAVLLSGDQESATKQVALEAGIHTYRSGLLPAEKVRAVEDLRRRYGHVAMVGDGVNDAPALAAASVGIAMGVTGTDAAIDSADIVLMSDDIRRLPQLFDLGRKAMGVVRQNVFLAIATKAVFLALSLTGHATLWMAVLADDGAALAVIVNGLRLLAMPEEDA
jgi:Cd2+/Zn2+-exporting ATPase